MEKCIADAELLFRFFLEELVDYIELSPKANVATQWKEIHHLLPSPLCDAYKPKSWKHIFTTEAVQSSLARVQIAGYDEKLVWPFVTENFAKRNELISQHFRTFSVHFK